MSFVPLTAKTPYEILLLLSVLFFNISFIFSKRDKSFSKDSLKSQLSTASKMGIKWVLIFGQKEALEDFITLKDMDTGVQKEIKLNKVVAEMKAKVKK